MRPPHPIDPHARALIDALRLEPHPEGGWFRETWRPQGSPRAPATCIHFLLEAGGRSRWHRVDADELWLHQGGGPAILSTKGAGGVQRRRLGPDVLGGEHLQAIVGAGEWQAAQALDRFALFACVVAPGFMFKGFELAPDGWSPDEG